MRQPRDPAARLPRWWRRAVVGALAAGLLVAAAVLYVGLAREVTSAPAADGHHDFLAFHSAGRLVVEGRPRQMYDAAAITALERTVIPVPVGAAGYMPYINPPFAAALQAPLGLLAQPSARLLWLAVNIPLALLCCWLASAGLGSRGRVLATAALAATFPFYQALIEGQWSLVILAGCLLAMFALRRGRPVAAGAGLATLALKPPLLVPVLVVLVCARAWRALLALAGVVAALVLVTLPWTGWSTQVDYLGYLVGVVGSHLGGAGAAGASLWHGGMSGMEGINGLAAAYAGQSRFLVVDALTAAVLVALAVRWALAARRVGLRFAGRSGAWLAVAGIAAALLGDLHLYPQDCVLALLALPGLLSIVAPRDRLTAVLVLAAALDLVWLDQLALAPHLLTWLLAAVFAWGTRRAGDTAALPAAPSSPGVPARAAAAPLGAGGGAAV